MLSTLLLLPLIGIFIILFVRDTKLVKQIALGTTLFAFLWSLFLWILFDNSSVDFQFIEKYNWIPFTNIHFFLGIDGISLFFLVLTTLLVPLCILASWQSITSGIKEYMICFLLMETLMLSVFCVLDLFLFYIFFESVLIPMFIIIGVWGSRQRKIHAAYQFFLYTLVGSVLMLLAIIAIYFYVGTTDIQILLATKFSSKSQIILWLAFFASFAVKVPMVPVHIWLPEAHVEAPTAGSMILAGILLKLGTYGFLRFSIPLFPEATIYYIPFIYTISVIGIIYASLTTIRQIDLKKVIAYSSVAHMSYVTLGMFSANIQGIEGSLILMLSHGLVSSALFFCVGILYDRYKTRLIKYYGGLVNTMPLFATVFLFFTLANMSLPGTSSFVGEFLILLGVFQMNTFIATLAGLGTILGASYAIWLYNRVTFGHFKTTFIYEFKDINRREAFILLILIVLTIVMGVYPEIFLNPMHASVLKLV